MAVLHKETPPKALAGSCTRKSLHTLMWKARYLIPLWRLQDVALCTTLNFTHIALIFLTIRFERPGFPRNWDSNDMNYSSAFSFKQASLSKPATNTKNGSFWRFTSSLAYGVRTCGNGSDLSRATCSCQSLSASASGLCHAQLTPPCSLSPSPKALQLRSTEN